MAELDRTIAVYPIGVVEKLTGLTGRQIRYYEKMGLVVPARTQGNQRLYAPVHVDRLLRVKELLAQGLNVEGVRAILSKDAADAGPADVAVRPTAGEPRTPAQPVVDADATAADEIGPAAGSTTADLGQVGSWENLRVGRRLGSLYPVDNQAELLRWLQQHKSSESAPQPTSEASDRPQETEGGK